MFCMLLYIFLQQCGRTDKWTRFFWYALIVKFKSSLSPIIHSICENPRSRYLNRLILQLFSFKWVESPHHGNGGPRWVEVRIDTHILSRSDYQITTESYRRLHCNCWYSFGLSCQLVESSCQLISYISDGQGVVSLLSIYSVSITLTVNRLKPWRPSCRVKWRILCRWTLLGPMVS